MTDTSQRTFINHWNQVAKLLRRDQLFKNIPTLESGLLSGGACAGFSFVLAEYVRLDKAEQFYKLYYYICTTKPRDVAHFILEYYKKYKEKNLSKTEKANCLLATEIIDFIYKIFILHEKQLTNLVDNPNETASQKWMRVHTSSANHLRIGNIIDTQNVNVGEISEPEEFAKLPQLIHALKDKESYEMGLYDESFGAHSILVYRQGEVFESFDSNLGKKTTSATPEEAALAVIYSLNKSITQGTDKYTLFDKLWNKNVAFKIGAGVFFPATAVLLAHDVFIAKKIPEEILKKEPLTKTAWISWGKIAQIPQVFFSPDVKKDAPVLDQPQTEVVKNSMIRKPS